MAQVGWAEPWTAFKMCSVKDSEGTQQSQPLWFMLSAEIASEALLWPSASRANEICQELGCSSDQNMRQQSPHKRLLGVKALKIPYSFYLQQMFEWDCILLFVIQAQPADVTAVSFEGRIHICQSKKSLLYQQIPSVSRAVQLCSVCKSGSAVPWWWRLKLHTAGPCSDWPLWEATPNWWSVTSWASVSLRKMAKYPLSPQPKIWGGIRALLVWKIWKKLSVLTIWSKTLILNDHDCQDGFIKHSD